jgi:hypothetical protein
MIDKILTISVEEGSTIEPDRESIDWIEWEEMCDRIQKVRDAERARARLNGLSWTPWRKMLPGEGVGAARCGGGRHQRMHTRRASSTWVSYGVNFGSRIVRCDDCHEKENW